MRHHLISLAQHCCKPMFWSQKSHSPVLTTHVRRWFPILRNLHLAAGARRSAFSGAGVIGLSQAQSYFGGIVRMTSTVNASQEESSLKLDKKEAELNQSLKNEEEDHLNLDEERKDRSREEMFEEASKLRTLF